jgi:hypothetical protein
VHGIEVVPLQAALWAGEPHLVRLQKSAHETQKKCYAEYHDDDGDETA